MLIRKSCLQIGPFWTLAPRRAVVQRATSADDDVAAPCSTRSWFSGYAGSLWIPDFRAAYEHEQAGFYVKTVAAADALYQQLHAATAAAARLVGGSANEPLLNVRSIAALDAAMAKAPAHPLAASFRRIRREVALLRWLSTVRNKAVQHRAEEGYVTSERDRARLRHGVEPQARPARKR
jgi:hypothetical protein